MRQPLVWRPSRLFARLATAAVLLAVVGIASMQVELLVVAAPCVVALAAGYRRRVPDSVEVTATTSAGGCVEADAVEVTVTVRSSAPLGGATLTLALAADRWDLDDPRSVAVGAGTVAEATWTVRPRRWGRWTVGPVEVDLRAPTRLAQASARVDAGQLAVYPPASRATRLPVPPLVLERIGLHTGRTPGHGVEFAGVRPYVTGDVVRRVSWAATARRRKLHVTQFAAERAADVVVVVDATTDAGPAGASSLDVAVRGGAGIAQAYLRAGDRVGVVAYGGSLRWLPPGLGARQLYRVVDAAISVRVDDSYVGGTLGRLPRTALPAGSLAVVLSPLLDPRVLETVRDLRQRGHPTVVVDVLREEPARDPRDDVRDAAVRLWRLERAALVHELGEIGVVVVPWGPDAESPGLLDAVAVRMDPRGLR